MTTPAWVWDLTDGTTTVTFDVMEESWNFPTPSQGKDAAQSFLARLSPGGGEDIYDLLDDVRVLRGLFDQARRYGENPNGEDPVYLRFKETSGGAYYRSLVLDGAVDDDPNTLASAPGSAGRDTRASQDSAVQG